jgi:glycine/D-amino acid oxidase-like deaminating enzyme
MTLRPARDRGTIALGRKFGRGFLPQLIDVLVELLHRAELCPFAAINLIESLFGRLAQPFQPGLFFLLALLKQPQAFAHDLAGVAVAAGRNPVFDEAVEAFRQIDVAGRHVVSPGIRIAELAKIASGKRVRLGGLSNSINGIIAFAKDRALEC